MAVVTYKCPNCGGGLQFDPATQKFRCEYCASLFTEVELEKLAAAEVARNAVQEEESVPAQEGANSTTEAAADSEKTQTADDDFAQAVVYSCPSCGAEVVCDKTTAATFCFYCHNPVVLAGRLSGSLKPDKVIPFTVTREQAEAKFLEWTGKKWFIPRAFFDKKQIEKITGVYFPYWFADCDLQGRLDTTGTQIRIWRMGDTEYTETKVFRIVREGNTSFSEMSRVALKKPNNSKLVEAVQPFDTSKMLDFSMSYLSGFQAEKRDIESAEIAQNIAEEAKGYTESMLRNTASGYATVSPGNCTANLEDVRWRYALLPVWVLTYNSGGRMYYYAMNGQTGQVCGELPIDWKRLVMLAAGIAVPLFGLLTLGGYLM